MAGLDPQYVISGLVARGVPLHVAQGVTARLNGESRLDPGINEVSPTVAGSRGGFGLAQWTGPRRKLAICGLMPTPPKTAAEFTGKHFP